jgi:hypothetical protein
MKGEEQLLKNCVLFVWGRVSPTDGGVERFGGRGIDAVMVDETGERMHPIDRRRQSKQRIGNPRRLRQCTSRR